MGSRLSFSSRMVATVTFLRSAIGVTDTGPPVPLRRERIEPVARVFVVLKKPRKEGINVRDLRGSNAASLLTMRTSALFVACAMIVVRAMTASACSVSPLPPKPICERFWDGDAVVLAEVTDIREENGNHRRVSMRVLDTYRGAPPPELTVDDPWTSCGLNFGQKGQYLVWLFHKRGSWTAYSDRAARRSEGGVNADVLYAQSMKHPPSTARIFGTLDKPIFRTPASDEKNSQPSRQGSVIVAEGPSGVFNSYVSADLSFDLPEVTPGKYTIKVVGLPSNLSVTPEEVQVQEGGCKQMFLFSGSSAGVKGRVFGFGKQPQVAQVSLVAVDRAVGQRSNEMKVFADSETGAFEFTHVQPGRYVLGFELGHSPTLDVPYAPRYYVAAADSSSAKVIDVTEGQQVTGIDFDLGLEVPRRQIHVRVTWADGSPVRRATAYLRDAHNPYSSVANKQTETNEKGEALLEGFIDTAYDVDANAVCKGAPASRDIKKKVIAAGTTDAFVELRVSGRKCVLVGNDYLTELEESNE